VRLAALPIPQKPDLPTKRSFLFALFVAFVAGPMKPVSEGSSSRPKHKVSQNLGGNAGLRSFGADMNHALTRPVGPGYQLLRRWRIGAAPTAEMASGISPSAIDYSAVPPSFHFLASRKE
jgi:hypothetical protein